MKKNLLLIFGIGDSLCSVSSPRYIRKGKLGVELYDETQAIIRDNKDNFDNFVFINEPQDSFNNVNLMSEVPRNKAVVIKLCSGDLFDPLNEIRIPDISDPNDYVVLDGDQFDHVFKPSDYNIFAAGIDIGNCFNSLIKHGTKYKYSMTIYSDVIKPFSKDTVPNIISASKNRELDVIFRKR